MLAAKVRGRVGAPQAQGRQPPQLLHERCDIPLEGVKHCCHHHAAILHEHGMQVPQRPPTALLSAVDKGLLDCTNVTHRMHRTCMAKRGYQAPKLTMTTSLSLRGPSSDSTSSISSAL